MSGTYCLTVNVAGCISQDTCMSVIVNEKPVISVLSFNNPTTCTPGNDGSITISGLTIDSAYIISYNNGTLQTISHTATSNTYTI